VYVLLPDFSVASGAVDGILLPFGLLDEGVGDLRCVGLSLAAWDPHIFMKGGLVAWSWAIHCLAGRRCACDE